MIETLKEVREALDDACGGRCNAEYNPCWQRQAIDNLDALIAAQEKAEPVAWRPTLTYPIPWVTGKPSELDLRHWESQGCTIEYAYAAPQSAPSASQPLTDEQIWSKYQGLWPFHPAEEPRLAADLVTFARAIEAAHGIGAKP